MSVVLFHTIHDLLKLERELKSRGVEVKPVPVPRELSSDCGSALRFRTGDAEAVRTAVEASSVEIEGIHELDE